jgi:hypothetical protein
LSQKAAGKTDGVDGVHGKKIFNETANTLAQSGRKNTRA